MKKMIGFAKENSRLYYLEENKGDVGGQNCLLLCSPEDTSVFFKKDLKFGLIIRDLAILLFCLLYVSLTF